MHKPIIYTLFVFIFINTLPAQDTLFYEDFLGGSMPSYWEQEEVNGDVEWHITSGSQSQNGGTIYYPDSAAIGSFNANFQKESIGDVTKLITPPIDLEFAVKPELNFWHAQVHWDVNMPDHLDELKVYYREGEEGEWIELEHYTTNTEEWVERQILLPTQSDSAYIAFEGITHWGMGVCIDAVTIIETDEIQRHLNEIKTTQASTDRIASGTGNNVILGTELRIVGNTGNFILDEFTINSLNTDDEDIEDVKLFLSGENVFQTDNQISSGNVTFVNGKAEFTDLNLNLPTGYSYIWVAYDINSDAGNLNIANAYIPEDGILANDTLYPPEDHNPDGYRVIYKTIFYDDFDSDNGWELSGEFERDQPQGLGGTIPGQYGSGGAAGADYAHTGTKVLGTDLTGLGDFPGNYELNLGNREYQAISPKMNFYYYNDIVLNFHRWLNIYRSGDMDRATIDISTDDGETWENIWENSHSIASSWTQQTLPLSEYDRKDSVRIRFTLGPTGNYHNYSGWNIDNLFISGNYITKDVGVVDWLYPNDGCGLTDKEEVAVKIKNFGAEATPDTIPVGFSLDGGKTWHMDTIFQSILSKEIITHIFEPKADLSQPGRYNDVIGKTFLEGDQDNSNDKFHTSVFSIPTYELPYANNFENDDGLWTAYGDNVSWEWAEPNGSVINNAYSGKHAWITDSAAYYNSGETSWVESPCYSFPETDFSVIEFWLNTDTYEDTDGVSLQYSSDEGVTWETVEPFDEELAWNWFTNENISSLQLTFNNGEGWDGQSEGWFRPRIVLPEELANNDKAKFRFIFASDDDTEGYDGVALDYVQLYEAPHDVGVVDLINPQSDCELQEDQSIKISVKNFGINTIEEGTEIPVGVDVNELSPVYESFVLDKNLEPEETVNYAFETTFDLSEIGDHNIIAYTMLPGDTDFYEPGVFNDTLSTTVTVFGYPEVDLGEDIFTTNPTSKTLDAGSGFEEYTWQDGHDERLYDVTLPYTYEYSVTVTDNKGCPASDTIMVIANDISVEEITEPVSDCGLGENEQISVKVKNAGPDTLSSNIEIPLSIYYNDTYITTEQAVLTDDLYPGDNIMHTFDQYFDLSEITTHEFMIYHQYKDAYPGNDTLQAVIEVFGYPEVDLGGDIYTMQPDTVVLDAGEGFESYLWQDNSSGQYYNVTLPYSSDYSVTVTDNKGCPASDTVSVIASDLSVEEITEPVSDCGLGENEQISVKVKNAGPDTLSSNIEIPLSIYYNNTYITTEQAVLANDLYPGNNIIHTFDQYFDLSEITTHEFMIYHQYKDAYPGNDTLQAVIEVFGYPEVDLGEDIYTAKPDTVLLDAGEGFESYLWQDNSSGQYYEVTSPYTSNYSVTVTDCNECTNSDTIKVTNIFDIALKEIKDPKSSCTLSANETLTFSVKNKGYETLKKGSEFVFAYKINHDHIDEEGLIIEQDLLPDETYTFSSEKTFDFSETGAYDLKVYFKGTDANPSNDTIAKNIFVAGKPEIDLGGDIYTNRPDTIVLDAGNGFMSYLWHDGSTSQTFEVSNYGSHWVKVTNEHGCPNSDTLEISQTTGVETIFEEERIIHIYPNPAKDYINVALDIKGNNKTLIHIVGTSGNIIRTHKYQTCEVNNEHKIYIGDLNPGAYFIRIIIENQQKVLRFIKN